MEATSLTFSWDAGTGSVQDKYIYQYRDVSADGLFGPETDVFSTSVSLSGLSAGHQYEFWVLAVSGTKRSIFATITQSTSKWTTYVFLS